MTMIPVSKLVGDVSRRDLFRLAAVGAAGASACGWLDVVAAQALAQERSSRARAKACIVLFMSGGPAHTFTFDLKHGDRGCPYSPIRTSATGINISEYLPQVAKQMHHVALVRGMSTDIADHEPAHYLMRTGFRQEAGITHPHIGSTAVAQLVREDTGLPNFVLLKPGSGGLRGTGAGFLHPASRPLILRDVAQGIANLRPPGGFEQTQQRFGLLQQADQDFLNEYQAESIRSHLVGARSAVQMMNLEKAQEAFKIDKEPAHVRARYGETPFGRQCLGARRLVEQGVRFVEVMHPGYWDTHGGAVNGQRNLSQVLDQPMAALLADLHDRGMLEDTLVVWMGEFGRTYDGNDHYARAWTTAFAGAGVKGGQVIGRTDRRGMTVEDRPVKVADFAATIFKTLGINYTQRHTVRGRPIGLVDGTARPLDELFA
jgi:hypothetical protein